MRERERVALSWYLMYNTLLSYRWEVSCAVDRDRSRDCHGGSGKVSVHILVAGLCRQFCWSSLLDRKKERKKYFKEKEGNINGDKTSSRFKDFLRHNLNWELYSTTVYLNTSWKTQSRDGYKLRRSLHPVIWTAASTIFKFTSFTYLVYAVEQLDADSHIQ